MQQIHQQHQLQKYQIVVVKPIKLKTQISFYHYQVMIYLQDQVHHKVVCLHLVTIMSFGIIHMKHNQKLIIIFYSNPRSCIIIGLLGTIETNYYENITLDTGISFQPVPFFEKRQGSIEDFDDLLSDSIRNIISDLALINKNILFNDEATQ